MYNQGDALTSKPLDTQEVALLHLVAPQGLDALPLDPRCI